MDIIEPSGGGDSWTWISTFHRAGAIATIGNFNTSGAAAAWAASVKLNCMAFAF
jgi:hypothetical protein